MRSWRGEDEEEEEEDVHFSNLPPRRDLAVSSDRPSPPDIAFYSGNENRSLRLTKLVTLGVPQKLLRPVGAKV